MELTKHNQPWITSHIKQLTRKKQRAYNHACLTNPLSRNAMQHLTNVHDDNYKITKKLWSFVKNRRQDHIGIGISELDHDFH